MKITAADRKQLLMLAKKLNQATNCLAKHVNVLACEDSHGASAAFNRVVSLRRDCNRACVGIHEYLVALDETNS